VPDPRTLAVAAVAKAARPSKRWKAWDHDRELIARHAAQLRVAWRAQWPSAESLTRAWRHDHPHTKATRKDRDQALIAALVVFLWRHLRPADRTLAALTAALMEARQLGQTSALQAIADAGLATPAGTQALTAMETARAATVAANAAGRLQTSTGVRIQQMAAGLSDVAAAATDDELTAAFEAQLNNGTWIDVVLSAEGWQQVNDAAAVAYDWAAIPFVEWVTATDDGVCIECQQYADWDVIPADPGFPLDPPLHPRCRCAVLPATPPDWALTGAITDV